MADNLLPALNVCRSQLAPAIGAMKYRVTLIRNTGAFSDLPDESWKIPPFSW
jgi:hypothetical protein